MFFFIVLAHGDSATKNAWGKVEGLMMDTKWKCKAMNSIMCSANTYTYL